ncbi:DUF6286 domain-containing Asp23/Gls24 family envelope stress response protein [Streptomyces sp. HB132]|uniref:DUF6286 domain-containing Asp23/Gls24 family envelope stress response protein n=1 Tax=Streptomyces sp. HB132 TaxID=767388 RepID=UPI001961CAEA|nr:DUF6286 domain-containing Asp23/Gls24 family envelope stress response protein [Streptomyces sp. HB132]MBM7440262.1 putative alkaline shock family protein YloU [Streptomyces sp. HB132]
MSFPSQRGTTTVSDKVVRKIAGRAVTEALPGRSVAATRVSAVVRGRRTDVSLGLTVPYPAPVARTVRRVQEHVTARTRELTGLDVTRTRVHARSLVANAPLPRDASSAGGPARRTPLRWWSSRRLPMAAVAAGAAAAFGAVAVDVIRVHLEHRPAAAWRIGLLDGLSTSGPGSMPVVLGGAAAALLGLALIVVAVTPGRRRLVTLSTAGGPRAALDRSALAAAVRDAVADVAGISHADVRVGRRRIAVRAGLAFGDRATAHREATTAVRRAVDGCLLRRAPRVRVDVRPEPAWQQPPAADTAVDGTTRKPAPTRGET